jgi:hypothetical protein
VVLSLFNDSESLTIEQLREKMGGEVPDDLLNRILFSFFGMKTKILVKEPAGKKIAPGDK